MRLVVVCRQCGEPEPQTHSDASLRCVWVVLQGKRAPVAGSTDEALMGRLGEVIQGMKEDFMVVHFREPCSFCRKYLSDEPRCIFV